MTQRYIGLLDCNNFFVSCERVFRPDLVGKPVVVLSSNDGCVVARSQEVKDMGVPMGVPYFQIKDILQKAQTKVFSSHFALYRDISRRVFAVMREELDVVEQYSIDEAFFSLEGDPAPVIERLKAAVEARVGIPVSVGVAATKTQAKCANARAKKGVGTYVFTPDSWLEAVDGIALKDVWGVGGRLEVQYKQHGVLSVGDLLRADTARIQRLFGVGGVRLQRELAGQPTFSLQHSTAAQKSIMSSRSFRDATTDRAVLEDALAYHVRHAVADLRAMDMEARTMRISILPSRHGDFVLRGGSVETVFALPTQNTLDFMSRIGGLLDVLFEPGVPYKKAGVLLADFVPAGAEQAQLFSTGDRSDSLKSLMSTIDSVNAKQGSELVLLGSRLRTKEWQSRIDARSPAYTTRWSDIAAVKAR